MSMAGTNEEIERRSRLERVRSFQARRPQRLMAELDGVLESLEALNLAGAARVPAEMAKEAQATLTGVMGARTPLPGDPVAAIEAVFEAQGRLLRERFPAFHEEDEEA